MKTHLVPVLAFVCVGALGGCGPAGDSPQAVEKTGAESYAPSIQTSAYFTARKDPRACAAPSCGGYFVREVNGGAQAHESYVSGLDFSQASFGETTARLVQDASEGELVLLGSIGGGEEWLRLAPFIVLDAFRGMPGILPDRADAFYLVADRDRIPCVRGRCDDETASALNTGVTLGFDQLSVAQAAAPFVDQAWLADRVRHHGAIVAAHLRGLGYDPHGIREPVLDVSQVFVKLPEASGPCLLPHHVCQSPLTPTYERDAQRCLVFDACVSPDACLPSETVLPRCAEGYTLVTWPARTLTCTGLACDPAFLLAE
jgi:hypothetical protein